MTAEKKKNKNKRLVDRLNNGIKVQTPSESAVPSLPAGHATAFRRLTCNTVAQCGLLVRQRMQVESINGYSTSYDPSQMGWSLAGTNENPYGDPRLQ